MTSDSPATSPLTPLRHRIDNIDAALIYVLAERFRCTKEVGEIKATSQMPACDPSREEKQRARLHKLALEAGLDPEFAQKFFAFIVQEVIQNHKNIAARHQSHATDNTDI